jgi:hypothetical protein
VSKSKDSVVLTRREALLLSTTAGLGAVLSKPAFGSDSVKTGAHQEPGSVWSNYGRGESLAASEAACAVDGRVSGFDLWSELSAESASLDEH